MTGWRKCARRTEKKARERDERKERMKGDTGGCRRKDMGGETTKKKRECLKEGLKR